MALDVRTAPSLVSLVVAAMAAVVGLGCVVAGMTDTGAMARGLLTVGTTSARPHR